MQTYRSPNEKIIGAVITIGGFDGVHLAHQAILAELKKIAKENNRLAGVVSFDPSPQIIIHPGFHFILTPLSEKEELLSEMGMNFLHLIAFDDEKRKMSAEVFISEEIIKKLKPAAIVVGYDHRFGWARKGDITVLKKFAEKEKFKLKIVPPVLADDLPIKSTRIRERLLLGDLKKANELLGRNYELRGTVVKGRGLGKRIGFPTVNIQIKETEKLIPAEGVYVIIAHHQGEKFPGVMNIGHRPTFQELTIPNSEVQMQNAKIKPNSTFHFPYIEAFLFDLTQEIYGEPIRLELLHRLRPEQKFKDEEELVKQIKEDIEKSKSYLRSRNVAVAFMRLILSTIGAMNRTATTLNRDRRL